MQRSRQRGEFLMARALLLTVILVLMLLVPMWLKKAGDQAAQAPPQKQAAQAGATSANETPAPGPAVPAVPALAPVWERAVPTAPDKASGGGARHGLTFVQGVTPSPAGVIHMSCHGKPDELHQPHAGSCNPYRGDTSCQTVLPVLCIQAGSQAEPLPPGVKSDLHQGWTGTTLAATQPVMGAVLSSSAAASARCAQELGTGWRMAEFHDGRGGWGFQGRVGAGLERATRYWVHVNDQRGNCWDSGP